MMRKFYSVIFLLTITNLCVANSLLALGTNTNAFLADLNVGTKTDYLSSHIKQLTDGHVEAWKTIREARCTNPLSQGCALASYVFLA